MTRVPVGRRNLFAERRRAVLGIAGVSAALLMVLALSGIFAGVMREVSRYIDSAGADVFVSQRGVRTMHMSSSSIPSDTAARIRTLAGVRWADPILYEQSTLIASGQRQLTYLIGFEPGGHGGPAMLVTGDEPGPGEVVLDEQAAATLGVGIGGRVDTLGRAWRISGLTSGMTNITNTVSYVTFEDFTEARDLVGVASYVLVGTDAPVDGVVREIEAATGLTAQSRSDFSDEERRGVESMSTELMQIMTLSALMIGLSVIGLTLYAATLSRLREIGVIKAIGGSTRRLGGIVLSQAAWTVGAALVIAAAAAVGLGLVLDLAASPIPLVVEWGSLARATAGAIALGALGAVAPLVKVSRVDPATVFRGWRHG